MPTINKENYLKTIYQHSHNNGGSVSNSSIAGKLGVSKAAATDMAKKLADNKFISYKKYKGISLTAKGEKIALQVIRRHRLWELFLIESLNMDWTQVHEEAETLEHQTSEVLINKIDEYLGFPKFDPHGHPIPNAKGVLPELPKIIKLEDTKVGKSYKMIRVEDDDNEFLTYISKIGLLLNSKFEVLEKFSFDNSVYIGFNNQKFTLSEKVSNRISVVPIK